MSKETKRKVSVILAAYHGEKYIAEQLKSLFQQTHPVDEILIGDDSLDDATVQAVQAVKEDFPGVLKIIRNPRSLGVISNFEELYKIADGDIVFFCDQDDVWLPNKVELLVRELELHPECDLVFCDSFCRDIVTNVNRNILPEFTRRFRLTTHF
ncbi:MAG: glycosyltransferase [Erysipelotrichia bacterium]|nr:glycosyltransferase [Erysipelotrichia bacterium]